MPEFFICHGAEKPADFLAPLGSNQAALLCEANRVNPSQILTPGKVLSLTEDPTALNMANSLNCLSRNEGQILSKIVQQCGQEALPLASLFDQNFSDYSVDKINTAIGAASTAASTRLSAFEVALLAHQKALRELWRVSRTDYRGSADAYNTALERATNTYSVLETKFSAELRRYAPEAWRHKNRGDALSNANRGIEAWRHKNRGDALSNANRGITLATRNPRSPKMHSGLTIQTRYQASGLAIISKIINKIGNGAVALDAMMRGIKVMGIKEVGGDWLRESVRQLTGFGTGGAAGLFAGRGTFAAGTALAAHYGLLVGGPFGWAVLGGIFVLSLGVGYKTGVAMDANGQRVANHIMSR
ncbi:MAG: hypothetical protein P8176_16305 [Gammaproteobacteria bacterium]